MNEHITGLQIAVLQILSTSDQLGPDIRAALAELGIHKRGAGFYQLMSRMEKAGLVVGWYEDVAVGTHVVQQRKYTITAEGSNAIDDWRSILLTAIA